MKHIATSLSLIVVVFSALFMSAKPASATANQAVKITSASCKNGRVDISWIPGTPGNTTSFIIYALDTSYRPVGSKSYEASASAGSLSVTNSLFANPAHVYVGSGPYTFGPFECTTTPPVNDGGGALQPVSVYCYNQTLRVYATYRSKGYLAFTISQAEVDRFPKYPSKNTLIKEANGVRLFRLTNGQLVINRTTEDGSQYYLIITTCVS